MSLQVTLFTLHSTVASVKPQFYWYRRAESSVYQMLFFYTVWEEVCVLSVHLHCSVKLLKTAV